MIVVLPLFRAVNSPSRIASKIFVRLTPALIAASSGLSPSRGMARPVTFGCIVSIGAHLAFRGVPPHATACTKWRGKYSRYFLLFLGIHKVIGRLVTFAQPSTAVVVIKSVDGGSRDSELVPDLLKQATVDRPFRILSFQRPDSLYDKAAQS